jgi:ATP-dependent Lon protease
MTNTPINLQEEYNKTDIKKVLEILEEELVGLKPVKSRIKEVSALLLVDKLLSKLVYLREVLVYTCLSQAVLERVKQQ